MDVIAAVHEMAFDDLGDEVIEFAERCVLDLCGVAAGALYTDLSRLIRSHVADHFGAASHATRILFDGREVSPAGAALAGGMTIDALDAHDGHRLTKGHSGCSVFPTAVAMADSLRRLDGAEFLTSIVLGYEIGTRAGIALHATSCDYHTSGAWGSVTCAAIASRALGLDTEATRHALGIAEYHGPRSQMMRCIDHPTMLKDGSGWGAHAGVTAAFLAATGFTGAPALTVEDAAVRDLWADLGSRWYMLEQYFKPHPVCRWAQPAVEAAMGLASAASPSIDHRTIAAIEIRTFHEAVRLGTGHPTTTEEAQYSLAFPVAAALVAGDLGPEQISAAGLADVDVGRLVDVTSATEFPAYDEAFPHRRYADVTITMHDGRRLSSDPTEPRGDPEAHLTSAEMHAKFRSYTEPGLGPAATSTLENAVAGLRAGGVDALLDVILSPPVDR